MVNRFLVTTALEETWPENPETPILLLGEWCRLYSRKEYWSKMNAEVLPYHWDDRNKLYRDYQYLQGFYEKILKSLADELNNIHSVDHSLRYWRILLGSWLGYFIQMLFDRWSSIDQALNLYSIDETIILDFPSDSFVSQGMIDFSSYYTSDEWNHYIYGKILESKSTVSIKYYSTDPFQLNKNTSNISQWGCNSLPNRISFWTWLRPKQ